MSVLESILRAAFEGVIRGVQIERGEEVPQEEIDEAFRGLAANPPPKHELPADFPPHSRDLEGS